MVISIKQQKLKKQEVKFNNQCTIKLDFFTYPNHGQCSFRLYFFEGEVF